MAWSCVLYGWHMDLRILVLVSSYWGAAGGARQAAGTTLSITPYRTLGTRARAGCTADPLDHESASRAGVVAEIAS